MKFFKKCILAAAAAAVLPLTAAADTTWRYNWAAADAALGVTNTRALSSATDELKFTAESVVRFDDLDNSGTISAGDTFTDYIIVRVDQLFFGGSANDETFFGYGPGGGPIAGVREITLTAVLTGKQVGPNNYTVDSGGILQWWYDSAGDDEAGSFTSADFADLATFTDGALAGSALNVENGIVVPPSGGLNDDQVPDGTIDIFMLMVDLLADPDDFEVSESGMLMSLQLGIADGNNNVCADSGGVASCFSSAAAILGFFGAGALGDDQFQFHTRTDGSFIKVVAVPEPGSLALAGLALAGLGVAGLRRRQKA